MLIVSEFVTIDGVMEAPGGEPSHPHTGWTVDHHSQELLDLKFREVLDAELLLAGRVTYESLAGAWPTYTGEFADRMNSMPKVVVSNTLTQPEWDNTTVLDGDAVAGVADLKRRHDGPIVVIGSATLVHALLDSDLVDEIRLAVFPVTIGAGVRVFPDTIRKTVWDLHSTAALPSGVHLDTYRPAAPAS